MGKINYLDLFSGIGGFHKGLEEAGFKFNWTGHSEIDKYAKSIYQKHFPQSEDLGDVSNINVSELPEIDLVTFGFPCQDLSIAGKRGGLGAARSGLFHEAIRIIEATKPSYFIFENVKGLFSSNNGQDFLSVLGAIADIGYDGQWQLLNTRWFLPQNRERIYFVGYPRERGGQQIFPIGEDGELSKGKSRTGEGRTQAEYSTTLRGGNMKADHTFVQVTDKKGGDSPTIPARAREDGSGQPVVKIPEATKQGYSMAGPGDSINLSVPNSKTRRGRVGKGEAQTLDTGMQQYTIQSGIRRLTPTECERLQGFPSNWTKYGKDGELISDTQRYKTLGNAVSVPVVKAVAGKLL